MAESIHQEVTIDASADRVYAALTNAGQFAALTAAPATIDATPGGAFSCFGGMIEGRTIELAPGLIVQAWRVANWPVGHYSILRFALQQQGDGTRLVFDQAGFPDDQLPHLEAGWAKMYWEPLKKYLAT